MYYCNSRYYVPEWGRWLNADAIIGNSGELLSHNLFAYCKNNHVNKYDPYGYAGTSCIAWTSSMWWLCAVDGPIPAGEAIYGLGIAVTFVADNADTLSNIACAAWDTGNSIARWAADKFRGSNNGDPNNWNKIKNVYKSIKDAPNYPEGFKAVQNGLKKVNINNGELLDKLRQVETGKWYKVYKDGYDALGNKISLHYFQSSSWIIFNLKSVSGWSN